MYHDLQLRIPQYPKISEDLERIPMGYEKLQIRGAEETILLSGSSLVYVLTDLLDGSRSIDAIVDVIYGLWEQQADPELIENAPNTVKESARQEIRKKVLDMLMDFYMSGLLEEEDVETKEKFSLEELSYYRNQLFFFSRYVDVTRASTSRYGLQLSLKMSRVLVFSSGLFGRSVAVRLCKSGIGSITIINLNDSDDCSYVENVNPFVSITFCNNRIANFQELNLFFKDKEFDLAIFATSKPFPELYQWMNTVCLERRLLWTIGLVDGRDLIIGPTIYPSQTGCYTCYASRQKACSLSYTADQAYEEYLNTNHEHSNGVTEFEHFSEMASGMFAIEILKIITFFSMPITADNKVFYLDLLTYDTTFARFLKLPRCPSCSSHSS